MLFISPFCFFSVANKNLSPGKQKNYAGVLLLTEAIKLRVFALPLVSLFLRIYGSLSRSEGEVIQGAYFQILEGPVR